MKLRYKPEHEIWEGKDRYVVYSGMVYRLEEGETEVENLPWQPVPPATKLAIAEHAVGTIGGCSLVE